jgi:hypothetical protein
MLVPAEKVWLMTERRASRRYELSFPIVLHTIDLGPTCAYAGRTRTISTTALHFILHLPLKPGLAIEFTIKMPAELLRGSPVFIRGAGKVLWVAGRRDQGYEIASSIERYDISRDKEHSGPFVDALL